METRRKSKQVLVGNVPIGGDSPITIQSMTNTDPHSREHTLAQINELAQVGCELIRLAVPDQEAANNLKTFVAASPVPLVADIHFDYQLALIALEAGVAKLRINPGNIGGKDKVKILAREAKARRIPIRIGVNAGSLEKELLEREGPTAAAMVESALRHVRLLEDEDFTEIVISLKASNVPLTIEAYRVLATQVPYPLHIGITEAGTWFTGTIRSSVGVGILLASGIGDTLRISLTGDPVREVRVGREILQSLGLRQFGASVISCPTCGRCRIDLAKLAEAVEQLVLPISLPLKIAVMGCAVNGPGEAREADLGVAGGQGEGLIFRKGLVVRKVPEAEILTALQEELQKLTHI